jgi:hypothetical protein
MATPLTVMEPVGQISWQMPHPTHISGFTVAFKEDALPPCSKPLIRSFITKSWASMASALVLSVSSSFSPSALLLARNILIEVVGRNV